MSPNNRLHSDGPRVARPAGERGRSTVIYQLVENGIRSRRRMLPTAVRVTATADHPAHFRPTNAVPLLARLEEPRTQSA